MRKYAILSIICISSILCLKTNAIYNRGEINSEIRQEMSDNTSDTSLQRWSDAIINDRINQAHDDINERVRPVSKNTTYTTVMGISTYTLPTDFLTANRVVYDTDGSSTTTKFTPLSYKTMLQMDRDSPGWEYTSSGTPTCYFYDSDYIYIHPSPGMLYCGDYGSLKIYYSVRASSMSSASSVPFEGFNQLYVYHKAIVWYVCALCAGDENNTTKQQFYWAKYMADVKEMQDQINNRSDRLNGQGITR